jgi:mono/diheme cytochrome c family protein
MRNKQSTFVMGALLVILLNLTGSCAGPQPLPMAINPGDEREYVSRLNASNADARTAYAIWMAAERNTTKEDVLRNDSQLSQTHNPFDAHCDSKAVSRGAVIYENHCARCHGNDARGHGPSILTDHPATDFKAFGKRFAATVHRGAPRKWFREIRDGSGDQVAYPDGQTSAMPAFGEKLTREQIWLAITYLQSLDVLASKEKNRGS